MRRDPLIHWKGKGTTSFGELIQKRSFFWEGLPTGTVDGRKSPAKMPTKGISSISISAGLPVSSIRSKKWKKKLGRLVS